MRAAAPPKPDLPVVIVNPTTPVGPGDWKPTPTGKIIVDFLNGRMPGYVDTGLNFVPVEDCAAGHLLAAERGRAGERYILGGRNLTLKQMLDMLAAVSGRPAPRWKIPYRVAYAAGCMDTRCFATAGPRAADSAGRGAHGAPQDVCGYGARPDASLALRRGRLRPRSSARWPGTKRNGYVAAGRAPAVAGARAA